MKYLLPFFKKYKKESLLAPLFKMLEATFDLIVPLVVAQIINVGIQTHDAHFAGLGRDWAFVQLYGAVFCGKGRHRHGHRAAAQFACPHSNA